jgi:hypothetical protein
VRERERLDERRRRKREKEVTSETLASFAYLPRPQVLVLCGVIEK